MPPLENCGLVSKPPRNRTDATKSSSAWAATQQPTPNTTNRKNKRMQPPHSCVGCSYVCVELALGEVGATLRSATDARRRSLPSGQTLTDKDCLADVASASACFWIIFSTRL